MKKIFLIFALLPSFAFAQQQTGEPDLVDPTVQEILEQIEETVTSVEHPDDGNGIILHFAETKTVLNKTHEAALEKNVIEPYNALKNKRIKVISYAKTIDKNEVNQTVSARRVSLERALLVREYLKNHGIPVRQVDMFPLGSAETAKPSGDYVHVHISD